MAQTGGKGGQTLYSYEVRREGGEDILYINYMGAPFVPSLAESPEVMEKTVDALAENPNVSRVVFLQQKNYNYDFKETNFLLEIAHFYTYLVQQEKILSKDKLTTGHDQFFPNRYNEIFTFLSFLKRDSISAYFELRKIILQARINLEKIGAQYRNDQSSYISLLEKTLLMMEKLSLISEAIPYMQDYKKEVETYTKNFFDLMLSLILHLQDLFLICRKKQRL